METSRILLRVSPTLAASKRLTDAASQTSHVELDLHRPRCCRSITSGTMDHSDRCQCLPSMLILLCASETWTLLASDMESIESLHIKCQQSILGWYSFVRSSGVTLHDDLSPVSNRIVKGQNAISGYVVRLPADTPAHQGMLHQVSLSAGPPDHTSKRQHGYLHVKWTDQLCHDNNGIPVTTPWHQAIGRGYLAAVLWSSLICINDDDDELQHSKQELLLEIITMISS